MFTSFSMTGTGIALLIIRGVLNFFGIEADDSTLVAVVDSVLVVVGWILTIWGQIRRKDLEGGFLRRV